MTDEEIDNGDLVIELFELNKQLHDDYIKHLLVIAKELDEGL